MVNQQTISGDWNQLKGRIRSRWGAITENELEQTRGDVEELIGLVQRKSGEARQAVEDCIEEFASKASSGMQAFAEGASRYARDAGDRLNEQYSQVSDRVRGGYEQATHAIQRNPAESTAVAFGVGMIAGVILGLAMRR